MSGPFKALLADPPWSWKARSPKGEGRSAKRHYKVMSLAEIKALDVAALAAKDSVLFLWVTNPMMPAGFEVIEAWGFTFKGVAFTWAKTTTHGKWHMGNGYWSRQNSERCLLATRGKPKRISASVRELVVAPRREHSRKPDEVYDRIVQLVEGPYVELFSREPRGGWSQALSDEADKFPLAA